MTANIFDYRGRRAHFIGIGGSSMSGLAGYLQEIGYTVTGSAAAADAYAQGKEIIGSDTVGGLKSVYIKGKAEKVPEGLEISKASLQTIFIRLTSGEKK